MARWCVLDPTAHREGHRSDCSCNQPCIAGWSVGEVCSVDGEQDEIIESEFDYETSHQRRQYADVKCIIPASTGTIHLTNKMRETLIDLEIVGYNHCDNIINDSKLHRFAQSMERQYYNGANVDWWNFWFNSHVLKRNCHKLLENNVRQVLGGCIPEDEHVGQITLHHQPGAGGTTTARQIMWDLRKEFRCAVVKNLSDQTCFQISCLHMYGDEEHPHPLLLLLDNFEDDRVSDLKAQLEQKCRQASSRVERAPLVFCVFLICRRQTTCDNRPARDRHVVLKHDFHPQELFWFKKNKTECRERNFAC